MDKFTICFIKRGVVLGTILWAMLALCPRSAKAQRVYTQQDLHGFKNRAELAAWMDKEYERIWMEDYKKWCSEHPCFTDWQKGWRDRELMARIVGLQQVNNETGTPGINPLNGALLRSETDLVVPGRGLGLNLTRFYNNKVWRNGRVLDAHSNRIVLGPISWLGLGWNFHMGRAWQDSADYSHKYWVFESSPGMKFQLRTTQGDTVWYPAGRYRILHRTFDGSGIRLREVGGYPSYQPDTLFLYTKDGMSYIMTYKQPEFVWNQINQVNRWYPTTIKDVNGNYMTVEYGYQNDPQTFLTFVYITRIFDSCNREYNFYSHEYQLDPGWGDITRVLDSIKTTDSNGQPATYKYVYDLGRAVTQMPFGASTYYDAQRLNTEYFPPGTFVYPLLKQVIYPNGDTTKYEYNGSLELTQIITPQQGKTRYGYGEYRFNYDYSTSGEDSTFKVRCITAESLWASPSQSPPDIVSYGRHYTDSYNHPLTNPDSVAVIDASGNQTSSQYLFSYYTNINKTLPYGLPYSKSRYQGNGAQRVLLNRTAQEWMWSNEPPNNPYTYKDLRVASETLFIYGTQNKKYVTRYRNYDAFLLPRRIDLLGDNDITSDDRSIIKTYLHGNGTKPVNAVGVQYGNNTVKFKMTWSTGEDEGRIGVIFVNVDTSTDGGATWKSFTTPKDTLYLNPPNNSGQWQSTKVFDVSQIGKRVRARVDFHTTRNGLLWANTPEYWCDACPPPPPGAPGGKGGSGEAGTLGVGDSLPKFFYGQNTYADLNIIGQTAEEKITSDTMGNNVLSDIQYFYDDSTRIIPQSYSPVPSHFDTQYVAIKRRGLITQIKQLGNDAGGGNIYYNSYKEYDQCGNLIKGIDANNHETRFGYAPTGNPSQYQYAYLWKTVVPVSSGACSLATYQDYDMNTGLLTVAKDPNGNETHYAYDNINRLRKVARPGDWSGAWAGWGSVVPSLVCTYKNPYPYSTIDSVKMNTTPQYTFTRTFRDGFGRVIQVLKTSTPTSDSSIVESISYDGVGNRNKVSYPYRLTKRTTYTEPTWSKPYWVYTYDALGRVKKKKHSSLPDSVVTTYDGLWSTVMDANGHITSYHQNASGKVDTVNAPLSANTYTTYDQLGRLLQVQDAEGKQTKYRYDYTGRLRAVKSPDATSSYSYGDLTNVSVLNVYDSVGNLRFQKNGKGITENRYDELNRLTGTWNNSTQKAEYVYDVIPTDPVEGIPSGLNNPLGKLNRIKDLNPTVETVKRYYDTRGRLGQRSIYLDALGQKTVQYNYNPADILTSLTYPDNTTVTYTYNLFGQVTGISGYLSNVKYNASYQPTSLPFADNSTTTISYDGRQRPLNLVTNYSILSLTYAFDHNLVSSITDNNSSARTQSFQHDALDRITNMTGNSHSESYTYHLDGNLWTYSRDGNTRTYNYTYGTDKLSSTTGLGAYNFSYEDAGNVTGKGSNTFTFDYNNLLLTANVSGRTITNSYNATGQRVKKVDSQVGTCYYIYEGLNIIAELDPFSGLTAKHVYGIGQHIAKVDGSGTHFFHNDAIGSVRAITKPGGSGGSRGPVQPPVLEKEYGYYPYGDSLYETGTLANSYKFGGKEEVPGISDGYDFLARYYDAEIGRYFSIDPLANGAISPYAYCDNNPLGLVDPTGMGPMPAARDYGWENSSFSSGSLYFDFMMGEIQVIGRLDAWENYSAAQDASKVNNNPKETEIAPKDPSLVRSPAGNSQNPPENKNQSGYVDLNGGLGFPLGTPIVGLGPTGGIMAETWGRNHGYLGLSLSAPAFLSGGLTGCNSNVARGWYGSISYGIGQSGWQLPSFSNRFQEWGLITGFSVSVYHAW